jgi:hypothetical protein
MKRYSGKKYPAGGLATPQSLYFMSAELPKLLTNRMFTKQTIG